ncbi:Ubp8 protein [Candida orthopsilosis Co 90-125]|uniref:Ubiquitin carboxyl-terminal hydrolase n=1 Tax=Candida orthopsilosis (strain 90-125) TaxID=1136231 RepID=H8X4A2_CANO9|nr:Ubp8 protein [Candida orthopsilosis Co 90-125]CCG26054.1 Ubp8 protein [Candida orthopsilosis Co 90-125]
MSSRNTSPKPQNTESSNDVHIKRELHNDSLGLSNGIKEENFTSKQLPYFQPDNFESIKSCIHLDQVLDSRAKNTVFDTYRQAVMISQPIDESLIYKSKKDGKVISQDEILAKKLSSLKCTNCEVSDFDQVMICLQCPNVGCAEHSQLHYKGTSHMFAIDSSLGLLYCFKCNEYINHPELEKLRLEVMGIADVAIDNQEAINANYTSPNKLAAQGLKGFVNLGATCFMSSTLQTLVHNPIIKSQFFNNDLHYFNCKYLHDQDVNGNIGEQNACITCSIDLIFKELFTSKSNEGFGITNLLTTAWYKQKSLAGFQEQDAHEFWQFVLNEFHQDHMRIQTQLDAIPKEETCTCITHSTFSFELQSCVKCKSCEAVTETVDPMIDLSLEINHLKKQQNVDLYDCLDLFTSEEKLDAMISCKQCSTRSQATKTLKLKSIPPVLSIQLKRFNHNILNDTSSKVETPVKVPLYLNIAPYSVNQGSAKDIVYELFSVICHIGSVNTGHYVVFTKNASGQWLKFDDSVVSIVEQKEVVNSNAYLLYYIIHNI